MTIAALAVVACYTTGIQRKRPGRWAPHHGMLWQIRVVHGSIFFDPARPNPATDWPNPIQAIANEKFGPTTNPPATRHS